MKTVCKANVSAAKPKRGSMLVKPAAKKAVAKPAVRRGVGKPAGSIRGKTELGYTVQPSGLHVLTESTTSTVITPGKLQVGIESAKSQIKSTLQNLATVFTEDFEVAEIELSVTFSADGKFLGFGTGGAMSIKVKIRPTK